MEFFQILVLAILQGVTEFLPISSSAHLILFPQLFDWHDQGLAFDVAVHVGTLSAVVIYFRRELVSMASDWSVSLVNRKHTANSRLAWAVLIGALPVAIVGVAFHDSIQGLRSPLIIAAATIAFGLLLWWADARCKCDRDEYSIKLSDALFIGVAQALALIPGTSRSGITITAGLLLGLTRTAAARFSFLLSLPTIAGAGLLEIKGLVEQAQPVQWSELYIGSLLSALAAYSCIHVFLKLVDKVGMFPFVIYRICLGIWLLLIFY